MFKNIEAPTPPPPPTGADGDPGAPTIIVNKR
jgi:hypothetical protein